MNSALAGQQHAHSDCERLPGGATSLIQVRAGRLERGLASLGIGPGDQVAVVCCDQHLPDRLVALASLERLGAAAVMPSGWTHPVVGEIARARPKAVLACEDGVAVWRDVNGTGILIGEGINILWWKALECRHSHVDSVRSAETA